ncbi:MAG: HNH endonuclease [Oscillospiraceae bacterium]|nr:HNH endonuclease [Oscillospiraceae bacterium]
MNKEIIFNGVKYRLMGGGRYYLSQSTTNAGRVGAKGLHVAVWEYYSGQKVPDGYCVHHIDGNTLNNDYSNLECVEIKKHLSDHAKNNLESSVYRAKNKEQLLEAQEKAKEWHKSKEGREWHKAHTENSLAKAWAFREERTCEVCSETYIAKTKRSKYCCQECKSKAAWQRQKRRKNQM